MASLTPASQGPRSVTTLDDEVARLGQSLLDLDACGACSVSLTECASSAREVALARALTQCAHDRGFVTALADLEVAPLDSLEGLVAHLLDVIRSPADTRPRGLLGLLDRYFERHGRRAAERFVEACEAEDAHGDLVTLCAAYLNADDDARREVRALELWCDGVVLKKGYADLGVRGALTPHSAQRVLSELTRILIALGYKGLLLVLHGGGTLASRTPRQREKGYTLLRELVDNFDTGRGAVATRIVITGDARLFEGPRSVRSLEPLLMRLGAPSDAEPPPPHRTWTSLVTEPFEYVHRRASSAEPRKAPPLRSMIRIAQGLPPTEAVTSMSVGHERIDRSIDKLFQHAQMAGSVLSVLVGDYGSGKTHQLMHLAERAVEQGHPVFWLNLERLNLDLGNPQRHLARLLQHSTVPKRRRPSAVDRAGAWTRSPSKLRALLTALEEVAEESSEEAAAAKKALQVAAAAEDAGSALERYLAAEDLATKPGSASYRLDAYRRLLLWVELLARLDGARGPVFLIDEAENLYTSGLSEAARRAALRTLAFYCGGALPGACVVLAMTPPALAHLRAESAGQLAEVRDASSTLPLEDAALFRRRLKKLEPDEVPPFSKKMRRELAERVRATHRAVRGSVHLDEWDDLVKRVSKGTEPPRVVVRQLVDELEAAWWSGSR